MPRLSLRHLCLCLPAALALTACEELKALQGGPDMAEKPTQEQTQQNTAAALKAKGNLTAAAAVYREMASKPGTSTEAHVELAALYRKMGQPEHAVLILREAQARTPGDTKILHLLGQALVASRDSREAVNIYDQLIAMEPDDAMAHNGKAVAFDSSGNHVAAQEIYQKALSISQTPAIKNNLGMSMILNDQLDDAIELLTPIAQDDSVGKTARQNLALAYGLKGNMEKALELNLQDMSPKQARENLLFYERYARLKKAKPDMVNDMQPVLDDAPAEPVKLSGTQEEEPREEPAPAAKPVPPAELEPSAGGPAAIMQVKKSPPKISIPENDLPETSAPPPPPFGNDALYRFPRSEPQ